MFKSWSVELGKLGPDAVERGIRAVDLAAGSYAPNMNKFIGLCRKAGSEFVGVGDSYSEQIHGGKLKPTPNGVPLCWTVPPMPYSADELRASGIPEDAFAADMIEGLL